MSTILYSDINSLGEFQFIGGTKCVLNFFALDTTGSPVDIYTNASSAILRLSRYGKPEYTVFQEAGTISSSITNKVSFTILSADTKDLKDKYSFQVTIILTTGEKVIYQGVILIIPRIGIGS